MSDRATWMTGIFSLLPAVALMWATTLGNPQAAEDEVSPLEDLTGDYDCSPGPGCDPAGNSTALDGPYLVTTYHGFWEIDGETDRVTVRRQTARSGNAEIVRDWSANVQWNEWTASETTECLCQPAEGKTDVLHCACTVRSTAPPHTVTVVGIDTTYPQVDTTRKVQGTLEAQPDGSLLLTIDGVPLVLRRI